MFFLKGTCSSPFCPSAPCVCVQSTLLWKCVCLSQRNVNSSSNECAVSVCVFREREVVCPLQLWSIFCCHCQRMCCVVVREEISITAVFWKDFKQQATIPVCSFWFFPPWKNFLFFSSLNVWQTVRKLQFPLSLQKWLVGDSAEDLLVTCCRL